MIYRTGNFKRHGAKWALNSLPSQKCSNSELSLHILILFPALFIFFFFPDMLKKNFSVLGRYSVWWISSLSARGFVCQEELGLKELNTKHITIRQLPRHHILKSDKWKMGMVSNLITFVFRCCWEQTLIYELATDTRFPAYVIYIWMGGRMDR